MTEPARVPSASTLARQLARYRYRYPTLKLPDVELHVPDVRARCLRVAQRILDELRDDGISVGAEEDAEVAIACVREMADWLCRAMDVHEAPSLELLQLAILLATAMDEVNDDDGITGTTARALDDAVGNASREEGPR